MEKPSSLSHATLMMFATLTSAEGSEYPGFITN
jgi:hypothetical protein